MASLQALQTLKIVGLPTLEIVAIITLKIVAIFTLKIVVLVPLKTLDLIIPRIVALLLLDSPTDSSKRGHIITGSSMAVIPKKVHNNFIR